MRSTARPLGVALAALLLFLFFQADPSPKRYACRYRLPALTLCVPTCCSTRQRGALRPDVPDPRASWLVRPAIEVFLCRDYVQEPLKPHWTFRIWRAGTTELLAELPSTLVVHILTHYFSQAHLTAAVLGLHPPIEPPQRLPLATAPSRGPLRAVGVPLRPVQEARRAARALRKGLKRKKAG